MTQLGLFLFQSLLLFLISRRATTAIFRFLYLFIKNKRVIFSLIALLYLPGTIVHEMSHFLTALALFLRVREITIFPIIEENAVKLGSVAYEKKDFLRGFLVGMAPFFGGLFFFYGLASFRLFPAEKLILNLLLAYLIFVLSSTMFSSRQDMVDFLYVIPVLVVIGGMIYFFRLPQIPSAIIDNLLEFINTMNLYLLISLIINIGVLSLFRLGLYLTRR